MSSRLFFIFLIAMALALPGISQDDIPVGTWRTHLTYHNAKTLAIAGDKVYAASDNGLFFYDKTDHSLEVLSKLNDLSDIGVAKLAYSQNHQTLIVAYQNGNIDLIREQEIINIRSILNSNFIPKRINAIALHQNFAYLSTGYGVVELDIAAGRIRESFANIGENGQRVEVFDATVGNDSLFVATEVGVKAVSLAANVNRLDFRNWRLVYGGGGDILHIAAFGEQGGKVLFTEENTGLWAYGSGGFELLGFAGEEGFSNLSLAGDEILLSIPGKVMKIGQDLAHETIERPGELVLPTEVAYDAEGHLWIADASSGLLRLQDQETDVFFPTGPFSPSIFRFSYFNGKIVGLSGGYNLSTFVPNRDFSGFYIFESGIWENFTSLENTIGATQIPELPDIVTAAYNPVDNHVYLGSFGQGLLAWDRDNNSFEDLTAAPLRDPGAGLVSVAGTTVDHQGNLWVTRHNSRPGTPSVFKLNPDLEWEPFSFSFNAARYPLDITIDDFNQKWVRLSPGFGGGVLVFDEEGNAVHLVDGSGNGGLSSRNVNALVKDLKGAIWLGTDRGVTEFFNPGLVLSGQGVDGVAPRFEGSPLLRDERVTALAVDGGNRKWVGTLNGLWLFSEDGARLFHFFNEQNSPLLSNNIRAIQVHPVSGEVFIGTDRGIISYRGTATEGFYQHQQVKVFPNPVRPEFDGTVSISGLSNDATVKITDVTGQLIWETRAFGGTATWNARNYNGRRAKTGIYLIFSASTDGQENFVAKVVVIE